MSDKVKLIIEIPKEDMEFICKTSFVEDEKTMFKQSPSDRQGTTMLFRIMDSVKNGTPLDDVKAEIEKDACDYRCDEFVDGINHALEIIEKNMKGENNA